MFWKSVCVCVCACVYVCGCGRADPIVPDDPADVSVCGRGGGVPFLE